MPSITSVEYMNNHHTFVVHNIINVFLNYINTDGKIRDYIRKVYVLFKKINCSLLVI